jgi:hypothetical protein
MLDHLEVLACYENITRSRHHEIPERPRTLIDGERAVRCRDDVVGLTTGAIGEPAEIAMNKGRGELM